MIGEPAATVVPLRDTEAGLEVLMLHRSSRGAFGGMWVFPGGRVDPEDGDAAAEGDDAVARRAAAREAREEAAMIVDPASLVPFAHWTPPPQAPRRYMTWFYLAPAGDEEIVVDGTEIQRHEWVSPVDMMRRRDAGEVELAPPTWMTLWRLAGSPTVADALDAAAGQEPEMFETRIAPGMMLWQGDIAYESGDTALPGPRRRLIVDPDGWRYEERA